MKPNYYFIAATIFLVCAPMLRAQKPNLFLKGLLTNKVEYGLTISPNKKTVYFVKTDSFYVSTPKTIYISRKKWGRWSPPEPVKFSDGISDTSPFLTPDGKRLFFTSRRPVDGQAATSSNIWYVDINKGKAGEPVYLKAVNSDKSEYSPTTDKAGNLYFGSYRDGGQGSGDLWWSQLENGEYQTPQNLGAIINSKHGEWGSCISADGTFLIFENSGKKENLSSSGDLYIAFKKQGEWTKPIRFENQLNSKGSDLTPKIHGRTFYFASNRPNDYETTYNYNNVDLYTIPLNQLSVNHTLIPL